MAHTAKKPANPSATSSSKRVVFTGKRVQGTWSLESALPSWPRRAATTQTVAPRENTRVRTLH
jgi:hypothetical protein